MVAGIALLLAGLPLVAAEWEATTTELLRKVKAGYGGLCGVVVDRRTGDVYVDVSERGLFRSTNQGKSWARVGDKPLRGRTEWPGCLLLDCTGKTKRLLVATVYGGPVVVMDKDGKHRKAMHAASAHVDWCSADWTDPGMNFVLALKHESGGLLIASRDGGKSFRNVGKGYGPAWVFDGKTAVVAGAGTKERPAPALLRTTDGGKSFKPCVAHAAKALPKWHDGTLYWLVKGALVTTTDKGETWRKVGAVKDGRYGPIFGKHARHLFVLTDAGIVESADGGASWSEPLGVPKELGGIGTLTWMEYDPVHDVVYVMRMGSQLFKRTRK
jgi:photosystem II stability/assembly factor-like uncharacterized protein